MRVDFARDEFGKVWLYDVREAWAREANTEKKGGQEALQTLIKSPEHNSQPQSFQQEREVERIESGKYVIGTTRRKALKIRQAVSLMDFKTVKQELQKNSRVYKKVKPYSQSTDKLKKQLTTWQESSHTKGEPVVSHR